jgi:hypothetical protein
MSQTTYEMISADALSALHDKTWGDALSALDVPLLSDGEALHPVTLALPYHKAFAAYVQHTSSCTVCSTESLWDQCPEGSALAAVAADACAAQDDLAVQN